MPARPTILTVFVASPGGLEDERDAIDQAAGRLNSTIGAALDVRIEVKRYEQLVGRAGAPQDQINPWVDETDVFIGILHRKWGSATENYASGFEEEFERALERWKNSRSPEISVFFKAVDDQSLADPGPQLRRVLTFRDRLMNEREAFYNEFQNTSEFSTRILQLLVEEMHKRGRIGATGQGYSPSRSGATVTEHVTESQVDRDGDIEVVLQRFLDVAGGRELDGALDFDRLELFGLSGSRDSTLVSTHLANRLFARRAGKVFRRIELNAWLRTYLADIGRVKYLSERVIPYPLILGNVEQLRSQLRENARILLTDDDPQIRRGYLITAAATHVRPAPIWPRLPMSGSTSDAFNETWSAAVRSTSDLAAAVEYWLSARRRGDAVRAGVLLDAPSEESRALGGILVALLAHAPDAGPLAAADPSLLASTRVQRLFPARNPYASITPKGLEDIITRYGTDDDIRLAAVAELVRRDEISESLLVRIVDEANYDEDFGYRWQRKARALIFDTEASDLVLRRFIAILGDLNKPEVIRSLTARLANRNPTARAAAGSSIEWDGSEEQLRPERAESIFQASYGTNRYRDLAAAILHGTNQAFARYLGELEHASAGPRVVEFVRERAKIHALRYLAASPGESVPPSWLPELRSLAREGRYFSHEAISLLLPFANSGDVDVILGNLNSLGSYTRAEGLRMILERATLTKLRELLDSPEAGVPAAALAELHRRRRGPSWRALVELLRSPDSGLRMAALSIVCETRGERDLRAILDAYISASGTYYYNVVCELERRAAEVPSTHPLSNV